MSKNPKRPKRDSFAGRLENLIRSKPRPGEGEPASPGGAADMASSDAGARPADALDVREGAAGDGASTDDSRQPLGQDKAAERNRDPVGTGEWVVRQGECIASIARDTGHFCDTIWNDEQNTALREARKDPYVLLPGDRVHVPPLREKWEPGQAEMRHRFRRRGWPEVLRIRVLRDGEPRGNQPYTLDVDGTTFQGTTDPDGRLSCPIIPDAKRATLRVGAGPDIGEHQFLLGGIDPIDEISGVQGRLNSLGFDCGAVDGILGPRTASALRDYQHSRRLPVTGSADEATRRQLQADYGC